LAIVAKLALDYYFLAFRVGASQVVYLILLYYTNYGVVKSLWSRAGKSNPVTAIGALLKGANWESSEALWGVPSALRMPSVSGNYATKARATAR